MKRRFDIRSYLYLLIPLALVLYALSTFVFGKSELSALNIAAGLLILVANAAAVYFTVEFFSLGINHTAPLIFAILALSFPSAALFDMAAMATLPVCGAFFLAVRYHGGQVSDDMVFLYNALLALASLLFYPLAWLAVFLLAMNFTMAADKARYVVMSVVGFMLPLTVYLSYLYVTYDLRALSPVIKQYLLSLVAPAPGLGAASASRVIKVFIFIICYLVALVKFFRRSAEYSVSHSHVMILIFSYTALTALLLVLFPYGGSPMNILLLMVPFSIVLYDYLVWGASDRECRTAVAFAALAVLLEYAFVAVK